MVCCIVLKEKLSVIQNMSSLMPFKKRLKPPSSDPEISEFDSMCSMNPRFVISAHQFQQSIRQETSDIIRTILFFGKNVSGFTRIIRSRLYNIEYNALFEELIKKIV